MTSPGVPGESWVGSGRSIARRGAVLEFFLRSLAVRCPRRRGSLLWSLGLAARLRQEPASAIVSRQERPVLVVAQVAPQEVKSPAQL